MGPGKRRRKRHGGGRLAEVAAILTCRDAICTPTATTNDFILPVYIERVNVLYDRSRRHDVGRQLHSSSKHDDACGV